MHEYKIVERKMAHLFYLGKLYSCEHMTQVHLFHNHGGVLSGTLLKGRGIGEEEGDQEERQGSGDGGRSIVVPYLSNDIRVCSSFILANETMISFII